MNPIRIVLAEDHALVREGTCRVLEQHADLAVVGEAGDGQEALELAGRLKPDVVIVDIRMPRVSGIDVVRRLRDFSPATKALVLTAYDDEDYIVALMEAGASGYMLKTCRATELVDAVRNVHQGEPVLHPAIAAKVARMWAHHRASAEQKPMEMLSPREQEVLELAAEGLRNKAIADRLGISVRTVEGHLNSILAKLGVSSRLEAVLYGVSQRWITLEEHQS